MERLVMCLNRVNPCLLLRLNLNTFHPKGGGGRPLGDEQLKHAPS